MKSTKIFVTVISLIFASIVVIFVFFPRSTYSELERRELATPPPFSIDRLKDGSWASDVAAWFSDTEPFRDHFMTLSMMIKGNLGIDEWWDDTSEAVTFHTSKTDNPQTEGIDQSESASVALNDSIVPYVNNINADEENAKISHAGILVVGKAPEARAMMTFGASGKAGNEFAAIVNKYKETFGDKVNVYCMLIPNSIEFYCPDKAKNTTKPQIATINNVYQHLVDVKGVDCYTPLSKHVDENIYLRTDHHWAPRGAYYAAEAFAKEANVPFADLSTYTENVVHRFVGTMYGYSNDIAVKQSPEDFIYYTPNGVDYTTTYTVYNVDKNFHILSESKPQQGPFFYKFKDGSGSAYSTFLGSDYKITHIKTSTKNGRRLLIFKDSFGNALPGYLFHSFEDIHVIDYRYFTRNIKKYVEENDITDILFAHSIFMCLGNKAISSYNRFLTQADRVIAPVPTSIAAKPADKNIETDRVKSQDSVLINKGDAASDDVKPEIVPVAANDSTIYN